MKTDKENKAKTLNTETLEKVTGGRQQQQQRPSQEFDRWNYKHQPLQGDQMDTP